MRLSISQMSYWEFGALKIAHPEESSLRRYFELLERTKGIPGAVLELGVAQGASLITTSLLLEDSDDIRRVVGIDTFSGFPDTSHYDDLDFFEELFSRALISEEHLEMVRHNRSLVGARGGGLSARNISSSGDFSATSFDLVASKLRSLELEDRVKLISGKVEEVLESELPGESFSVVLFDTDLYASYAEGLPLVYDKLSPGGWIYLDEYFSLKFPGPRLAVSQVLPMLDGARLTKLDDHNDFERWAIQKTR